MRAQAAAPEWNEQLSFVELFPPLTRSLRLQLRDDAPLVDAALATHVLDLRRISHPGRAGECFWPPQTRPHSPRSHRAVGPIPNSKPNPRDPAAPRKAGPPAKQTASSRPQTVNPTIGLALLAKF